MNLVNGTIIPGGARVSSLDIDKQGRYVRNGGQAIQRIVDSEGQEIGGDSDWFGQLDRLSSSSLFGPPDGLEDWAYFTGEEVAGGIQWSLDPMTFTLYEMADAGNGAWEPGRLLLFDVQAHSLRDGIIEADGLEQGGQLLLLDAAEVVICPADLDGNGVVDVDDLVILIGDFGSCSTCVSDIDRDGDVDIDDLLILLMAFGDCA